MDDQRPPDPQQAAEEPQMDEQGPPDAPAQEQVAACEQCRCPCADDEPVAEAEPERETHDQPVTESTPAPATAAGTQLEVGVAFPHNAKVYSFASGGLRMSIGDKVLVRTDKGVDLGDVVRIKGRIAPERAGELTSVVRLANADDLAHVAEQEDLERKALQKCEEKITEHKLPMKLIDAHMSFDNTRLVFLFTAEGRVDFRDLVRDLAKTFKMRIELRQVGVRDEAKLLGGLGPCGRQLCCKMFMRNFEPVGIRIAKDQGLALNPAKLSGLCDRLMCCLRFEHETYLAHKNKLPGKGTRVQTPDGVGEVVDRHVLTEQLTVRLGEGRDVTVPMEAARVLAEGEEPQFVAPPEERVIPRGPERPPQRPSRVHTREKPATPERADPPRPADAPAPPQEQEEERSRRRGRRRPRSRRKGDSRPPAPAAGGEGPAQPPQGADGGQKPAPADGQERRPSRRRRGGRGRRRSRQSGGGSQEGKS